MPFFKGEVKVSPRKEFLYWSDDGDLLAIRVNEWKVSFKEQEHTGLNVWQRDFTNLRAPRIYNLRTDPGESIAYCVQAHTELWLLCHRCLKLCQTGTANRHSQELL